MRYQSKSSIAYMFRNFWQLILVALPVSLSFAFFMTPDAEINFVRALIDGELNGGNLLTRYISAVTVLRYGKYWWTAVYQRRVVRFDGKCARSQDRPSYARRRNFRAAVEVGV